ncbi:sigma-70 family RNA polymerase sigma factor [Terrilactibacillus sp. S3-3]|nr:sigma-70 family RNA polymerase sigma factor [Terrilactibacillus sp. S3-3]
MSYSKLLAGCKQTDEEAFERLFAQYKPMMAKAVRKYSRAYSMHCQHDIQDMQQIARIAFWKADRTFDLNKVPSGINLENDFSAFAKKTIEGRLMDSMKKKNKSGQAMKNSKKTTPRSIFRIAGSPTIPSPSATCSKDRSHFSALEKRISNPQRLQRKTNKRHRSGKKCVRKYCPIMEKKHHEKNWPK